MGKFRNSKKGSPLIPTAALPDIIFILLFFFMVATKMRKADPKVIIEQASATQIQAVPETMETIELFIGKPKDAKKFGTAPVIQAGERFITADGIPTYISQSISKLPMSKRRKSAVIVNIKMDEDIQIGILIDVKQKLRAIGIQNINYTAVKNTL